MCNPQLFSWDRFLEKVRETGFEFETMPFGDWMQLLRNSASNGDEKENPAVKLLDHFELRYSMGKSTNVKDTGVNDDKANAASPKEPSVNSTAINKSKANGTSPDHSKVNGAHSKDSTINGSALAPLRLTDAGYNANKTNGTTHSPTTSLNSANAPGPRNLGVSFDTAAVLRDSTVLRQPPNIIEDGDVQKFMSKWMERRLR